MGWPSTPPAACSASGCDRHRRGRDVRRLAGLAARARRRERHARRPVRAGRPARDLRRRDAADPLRHGDRRRLHGDGAAGAHAVARARGRVRRGAAASSAASRGSRTREDGWEAASRADDARRRASRSSGSTRRGGRGCSRAWARDDLAFVLLEPEAGVLRAQRACAALAAQAAAHGARLVRARARPDGDAAVLDDGTRLEADAVVWACGGWLARLFGEHVSLRVTRQELLFLDGGPAWRRRVPGWVDYDRAMYGTARHRRARREGGARRRGPAARPRRRRCPTAPTTDRACATTCASASRRSPARR